MIEAQQYRTTHQVPLVRLAELCRSIEKSLAARYPAAEASRIWRLYLSAECPICGIRVFGDELRALAFPPDPELASAKIGRMRLGDCARRGCQAWHYGLHCWHQDGIDWHALLQEAEERHETEHISANAAGPRWFAGVKPLAAGYAPRLIGTLALILGLWIGRQLYQGGPIPFLREPAHYATDTTLTDDSWPTPLDGDGRWSH